MQLAIVHDYLSQRGGAERVTLALLKSFPGSRLITSVYESGQTFPEFARLDVETSFLQRATPLRRDPRKALPLLAAAFDRLHVAGVDAVICSSSGWAHGVSASAPKVVYCHNPARWLYQPRDYVEAQPAGVRAGLRAMRPWLRRWDRQAAFSSASYLANSTSVQRRIEQTYGIQADVVHPPVTISPEGPVEAVPGIEPGFFMIVSRARSYKNVAVVRDAFARLPDERLLVVGALPPGPQLENVTAVKAVSDARLRWLYSNCRAVVSAANEDFGLTPVEGYTFGKPSVCLRAGGFLDTLVEDETGTFIEELVESAVVHALERHLSTCFDRARITEHAKRWSLDTFADRIRREVEQVLSR